jgi:uncharacterized protein involved in outer membrane biogenesis
MRWKWILGISAAVIVALLVTVYIILLSYDYNKFKPQITKMVKEYTGRELTLSGDIKLGIGLYPTLEVEGVALQNAAWGTRPNMITVKRAEVQVGLIALLQGNINLERIDTIEPDFILEINKAGKSNMEFDIPKKPAAEAQRKESEEKVLVYFGFKEFSMKNGELSIYDHRDNTTDVLFIEAYTRETEDFNADSDMEFVGAYNDIPIKVKGTVGPLDHIFDPTEKWDLDLLAEAFDTELKITGSIQDVLKPEGFDVKLSAGGDDFSKLEKITRTPLPLKGPFNISGKFVAPTLQKIQLSDISIQLGESKLKGSAEVDHSAKKPRIAAKLTSETLDLRPILAQEEQTAGDTGKQKSKPEKKTDKVFPNTPLELEGLQKVNATIDLQIKQILLPRLALDNFKTKVVLKDGHLIVNPLVADVGGGRLDSHLDLLAKGSQATASVKVDVKKLDLGEMLRELQITDALDGMLDLDINLKGQGNSVAALMAGLNGDFIVILGEGKMPVKYLNLVGADLTSSLTRLLNPFGEKIDRAQINCAVCDFNIKDGMANSDIIMIDDPRKTLISKGTINLKTEALDFDIQTKPKEGIGTENTAKISVSLSEITKPFKLSGTLANPSLQIDLTRTATTFGRVLLGPLGIASLFVSGSAANKNPCEVAFKIAGQGTPETKPKSAKEKGQKDTSAKKKEGLGSKIKGLFSKPKE